MNKTLTLVESQYSNDGTIFEEILKKSIESYLRNIYYTARQTSANHIKYN